jgi:pSer/pThr/pTyr-binding forkhead associated (FHA) protein
VITCPKCFKENQDHYKFCLGCGAELPRDVAPKKFVSGTPPHGVPAQGGANISNVPDRSTNVPAGPMPPPAGAAPPAQTPPPPVVLAPPPAAAASGSSGTAPLGSPPAVGTVHCPQCEHPNPTNNKFCASCGFKLTRPEAAAPPVATAPAGSTAPTGVILTALRADGSEAGSYAFPPGNGAIGRDTGAIFAGDSYLSPRHATFTQRNGKLFVHDDGSLNGVYKRLQRDEPMPVNHGEIFRIGQEILRYEPLASTTPNADGVERLGSPSKDYIGRIALVIGRDATGNAYPVPTTGIHLGRERGDVLFPEDGYVSGLHCRLAPQNGQLYLTDLGSSNGTFIRVQDAEVANGDILLMGQQLFRINI